MAEKVTIASLDFEDFGALKSIKDVQQWIGSLEKQTHSSGDAISKRFFSMHQAATAFLGAFTIGGGILAFKAFLGDVFSAQENFKTFSTSLSNAKNSVFQLAGEILGFNVALQDTATILDNIKSVSDKAKTGGGGWLGIIGTTLWGMTPVGKVEELLHLTAGVLDKVNPPGTTAAASTYGPNAANYGPQIPKTQYDREGRPFAPLATKMPEGGPLFDPEYMKWLDDLHEKTQELTGDTFDLATAYHAMPKALRDYMDGLEETDEKQTAFQVNLKALQDSIAQMSLKFELAMAAAQGFAQALVDAAESGHFTIKKFLGTIIRAVGQAIVAYGTLIMAEGIATWDPSRIALGAGYIVAGAATMAVGSRMSSEGGGDRSGSLAGASSAGASSGPASPNYNITFVNEGHIANYEEYMRNAAVWIKRALADGAAGGALA